VKRSGGPTQCGLPVAGSHPTPCPLAQVTRQVDNGPIIAKTMYQLADNAVARVDVDTAVLSKAHAFKNYKCVAHDRFFGVDLFREGPVRNAHHMRLAPFAHRNDALMAELFAAE
jgi:hypothetical protein